MKFIRASTHCFQKIIFNYCDDKNMNATLHRTEDKKIFFVLCIVVAVLLSRFLFAEVLFYDADTIGVAMATKSFSLADTRPHLPGYFLHVQIIKALNFFISNLHLVMILLSVIYCVAGAVLAFNFLSKWFDKTDSLLIVLLILSNPLVWYQTATPEVYAFDFLFSALTVTLGTNKKLIYLLPVLFGLGTGVRQTSGVLLFPLYIFLWAEFFRQNKIALTKFLFAHIAGAVLFCSWFIPMINSAGGLTAYLKLYQTNSPLPRISLLQHLFQFSSYLIYIAVPLLLILIFYLITKKVGAISYQKYPLKLLLWWIIPPMLVFTFFTYHKGYFLLIVLPVFFFAGILLNENKLPRAAIIFVAALQSLFFILFPYRESSLESLYAPKIRTQSLSSVWVERTFTSYLMSYRRIKAQEKNLVELARVIGKINSTNTKKNILLDPTVHLYARALQMIFPDVRFITMDLLCKNHFVEYTGIDIAVKNNLDGPLLNSVVITRKEFYERHLSELNTMVYNTNNFSLIEVDKKNDVELVNIYYRLFLR
jgi:hypothetical protein